MWNTCFSTFDILGENRKNVPDIFPTPRNCRTLFWTLCWTLLNDFSKSYTRLEWPIITLKACLTLRPNRLIPSRPDSDYARLAKSSFRFKCWPSGGPNILPNMARLALWWATPALYRSLRHHQRVQKSIRKSVQPFRGVGKSGRTTLFFFVSPKNVSKVKQVFQIVV